MLSTFRLGHTIHRAMLVKMVNVLTIVSTTNMLAHLVIVPVDRRVWELVRLFSVPTSPSKQSILVGEWFFGA